MFNLGFWKNYMFPLDGQSEKFCHLSSIVAPDSFEVSWRNIAFTQVTVARLHHGWCKNRKLREPVLATVMLLRMAVSVEAQPLIAVRDVRASSRWYGKLFAADSLPDHKHRDSYY